MGLTPGEGEQREQSIKHLTDPNILPCEDWTQRSLLVRAIDSPWGDVFLNRKATRESLDRQMIENHFVAEAEILALLSQTLGLRKLTILADIEPINRMKFLHSEMRPEMLGSERQFLSNPPHQLIIMSSPTIRQKAIDAAGTILIKQGYDWVDLDTIGTSLNEKVDKITSEFPNKALICEAWMDQNELRTRAHHDSLLKSGKSPREILDDYFAELEKFMVANNFGGCPYTNTARAIAAKGVSAPEISLKVKEHKNEIRRFFTLLCTNGTFHPKILSEALFLIYSGATTESANIYDLSPVKAGRQASLSLFEMYSAS